MRYHTELLPDPLPAEPLVVVSRWLEEAWKAAQQPNPNAMVVATVDPEGQPSARVVLCKDIVPIPGYLVFYTNYQSRKGRQLTQQPSRGRGDALGCVTPPGASRGACGEDAGGRQRQVLRFAGLAEPAGRLGQPAE